MMTDTASTMPKPLISIVCCTHNRLEFVRTHFEALRGHLDADVELLYALDHCNDGTLEFLQAASAQLPKVRLLENDGERGLFSCRNFGIRHARGDYIHFLDDDDGVETGFYARTCAALQAADGARPDLYLTRLMVCEPDGARHEKEIFSPPWVQAATRSGDELRLQGDLFKPLLEGQIFFNGANTLYSMDLLRRYGFRSELKKSADWLFCLESSLLSELCVAYNPSITANYVLHPASMSLSPDKQSWNAKVFDILLGLVAPESPHLAAVKRTCAMVNFDAGYANRHLDRQRSLAHYKRAFSLGLRGKSTLAMLKLAARL